MAKKKAAKKKVKLQRAPKRKALPKEIKAAAVVPALPLMEKELVEEEAPKPKDEFFKEEEMKEFLVKDEEEDVDEEGGEGGGVEPALDESEL